MKTLNLITIAAVGLASLAATGSAKKTDFTLRGGHFYGPGPIAPASALPEGQIKNIHFDAKTFSGYAEFRNTGKKLSDKTTRINENIDAGVITMGERAEKMLLVAVSGGPNKGRERYYLDGDYNMIWRVDLALDPGFKEGIIRVDDFVLTTGVVEVPASLQTNAGFPGGYDRAGPLASGRYLAGRLGDFDQNGKLDGVLVAAPNVPMASAMLPGAPVGNKRGFETDIDVEPNVACELTLRGLRGFRKPLEQVIKRNDREEYSKLMAEVIGRLAVARQNLERALLTGKWSGAKVKKKGFSATWRVDALQMLAFMAQSFVDGYPSSTGKITEPMADVVYRLIRELDSAIDEIAAVNRAVGTPMPTPNKQA